MPVHSRICTASTPRSTSFGCLIASWCQLANWTGLPTERAVAKSPLPSIHANARTGAFPASIAALAGQAPHGNLVTSSEPGFQKMVWERTGMGLRAYLTIDYRTIHDMSCSINRIISNNKVLWSWKIIPICTCWIMLAFQNGLPGGPPNHPFAVEMINLQHDWNASSQALFRA